MVTNNIEITFGASTAGLTAGVKAAKSSVSSLSTVTSASMASMVNNVGQSMRRMGNTLVGAAGAASIGFVIPIVRGMKDIIEVGRDAEDAIQRTMSVFNNLETPQAFTDLKNNMVEFVSDLAGETKYDFNQISEAMYTMAQSGKDANEIFTLTPDILKLSTAQMADIDETTKLTLATLNGYNMSVDDTSRVTNALAAATSNTMLRLDDLAVSSRYVNSTLGSLWGEDVFERGLALTGMLRNWGRTGMQSGRIIRDIFQSLLNPTAEVTRIMERNNINIYKNSDAINAMKKRYEDAKKSLDDMRLSGEYSSEEMLDQKLTVDQLSYELQNTYATGLKDLDTVLEEFASARERGMTEGELFAIGGKQSGGAFVQILENIDLYKDLTKEITGTNEAERQYEVQTKTLAYRLEILRSTLMQVKIELYNSISEPLKVIVNQIINNKDAFIDFGKVMLEVFVDKMAIVVDKIMGVVTWFNDLSDSNKKLVSGFVGTAGALALVATPLLLMGGIFIWITSPILKTVAALMGFTKYLKGANKIGGILVTTLTLLRTKVIAYRTSIVAANGVTGLLTLKMKGLYKSITNVSLGLARFLHNVPATVAGFVTTSLSATALKTSVKGVETAIKTGLIPSLAAVAAVALPITAAVIAITAALAIMYVAVRDNWGGVQKTLTDSIEFLKDAFKPLIDAVNNVIGVFANLSEALKTGTATDIVEAIGAVIGGIIGFIFSIPASILNTLGKITGQVASIFGNWLSDIGKDVSKKGVNQFLVDVAKAIIDGAISIGGSFLKGFWDGVTGAKTESGAKVLDSMIPKKSEAKTAGEQTAEAFAEGFETEIEEYDFVGITDKLKTAGKGVDLFSEFITFKGGISKSEETLMNIGQKLADEYGEDIPEDLQTAMKDALKTDNPIQFLFDWIHDNMPKYADMLSSYYFNEVKENVEDAKNDEYGAALDFLIKEQGLKLTDFTAESAELIKIIAKEMKDNSGALSDEVRKYIDNNDLTLEGLETAIEAKNARIDKAIADREAYKESLKKQFEETPTDNPVFAKLKEDLENKEAQIDEIDKLIAKGDPEKEYANDAEERSGQVIDILNKDRGNSDYIIGLLADKALKEEEKANIKSRIDETSEKFYVSGSKITKEDLFPPEYIKESAGDIIETGAESAKDASGTEMTEVGKKLVTDVSNGVQENKPVLDEQINVLTTSVETDFTTLISSATDWGAMFVKNLVAGMNSQMNYFTSTINSIKQQMMGVQFMANPEAATNASLLDALNTLNTNISAGGVGKSGANITVTITGNNFNNEDEMDANEIGALVEDRIVRAFNNYDRRNVV